MQITFNAHIKIALILLIAAALRIPGIFWGDIDRNQEGIILEPDEFQHSDLAADYMHRWDPEIGYPLPYQFWNSRGFGYQMAWIGYLAEKLGTEKITDKKRVMIGRFLSVFYELALIFLLYHMTRFLFQRKEIALLATLFMALCDLTITLSHYALPESAHLFWCHASVFSSMLWFIRFDRTIDKTSWQQLPNQWPLWLGMTISAAMAFATKFDFIPLCVAGLAIIVLWLRNKLSITQMLTLGLLLLAGSVFFVFLAHGFHFSFDELIYSFKIASGLNQDAVVSDNHLLTNLITYPLGFIGGIGLVVFALAIYGKTRMFGKRGTAIFAGSNFRLAMGLWIAFLAVEFLTRWLLDTTFIRRANFVMPFLAVAGAVGFYYLTATLKPRIRKGLWWAAVLYTGGLAISSQANFWNDTRYRARPLVQELGSGKSIRYSGYAWIPGMPGDRNHDPADPDLWVIHEAFYGRVWKYFTTPFKVPRCCDEVYNCPPEEVCRNYQALLRGELDYKLVGYYPTREYFPERLLFKYLFGSYETFLGDVRVYQREGE